MNTRREFLRITSSVALAVTASGLLDPRSLFAATTNGPLLGIGYSDTFPTEGRNVRLGAASRIMSGDPTFLSRGARLSILGFGRAKNYAAAPGAIEFNAIFPILSRTPDHYPQFRAWSCSGDSCGSPISFRMPVTAKDGLQFAVNHIGGNSSKRRIMAAPGDLAEERCVASLGVNSGGDACLRGGVYVFAFREDAADREPSWSQYVVREETGMLSVPNLDATYLVMQVDYDQR